MNKLTSTVVALLILSVSQLVSARAGTLIGFVTASCGAWNLEHSKPNKSESLAFNQENALLAYLSGLNEYSKKDFLDNADNAAILSWIDNYCKANPLDKIYDAGWALKNELLKRSNR